ncbi:hypothetical protein AMTRI_Chr02g221760 [Amborella trichopoda]
MECNKEEALRAKGIAEKKMEKKDFVGAKKIILKAQQLCSDLENLPQMLSVCEVHCSAEVKVGGSEIDWYGILQVEQTADDNLIKKQYRKLALLLHPDKNKFSGAESAFKLIGEAMRVLSDRGKRSLHDMKIRAYMSNPKPAPRRQPQAPARASNARKQSGVQNNFVPNHTGPQFSGLTRPPQPNAPANVTGTFWTLCPHCRVRYQYYSNIMNRPIRCQSCFKTFIAYNIGMQGGAPAANLGHAWNQASVPSNERPQPFVPSGVFSAKGMAGQAGAPPENIAPFGASSFFQGTTSGSMKQAEAGSASGKEPEVGPKQEEVNKQAQHEKPNAATAKSRRRSRLVVESSESDADSTDSEEVAEGLPADGFVGVNGQNPRRSSRNRQHVSYNEDESDDDFMKHSHSKKARVDAKSSGDMDSQSNAKFSSKKKETEEPARTSTPSEAKRDAKKNGSVVKEEIEQNGKEEMEASDEVEENSKDRSNCSEPSDGVDNESDGQVAPETLEYQEPEFHDFDEERKEEHFKPEQVWAIYDNHDGMPRYYARIIKVFSLPFKLRILWFEPSPTRNEEIEWAEEELPVSCGGFKSGAYDFSEDRLMFSHLVSFRKVSRSLRIYPLKGDVWALFKDWDFNWKSDPDKHKKHKYEVVEVTSDFVESTGATVVYLVQVNGFRTLFHRLAKKGKEVTFQITRDQMFRFSHQVPAYRMRGDERDGIPQGSMELDPASLPSDVKDLVLPETPVKKVGSNHTGSSPRNASGKEKIVGGPESPLTPRRSARFGPSPSVIIQDTPEVESKEQVWKGINGTSNKKPMETIPSKCTVKDESKDDGVSLFRRPSTSVPPDADVMEYPDPEFHDFDSRKTPEFLKPEQIWALYDERDGLPRFYARINKVKHADELRVKVTWLEPFPSNDKEARWLNHKLPIVCGKFRMGKTDTLSGMSPFSHQVIFKPTGDRSSYQIYPQKGEIWALYKNWSIGWTQLEYKHYECEAVELLNDFSAELGAKVMFLDKVSGFRTVYKPRKNGAVEAVLPLPREALLRFSHQIPAFRLSFEKHGTPKGSWELDPAALKPEDFCERSTKRRGDVKHRSCRTKLTGGSNGAKES